MHKLVKNEMLHDVDFTHFDICVDCTKGNIKTYN